jgi:tetratricopeptide (TPR) repeat protein
METLAAEGKRILGFRMSLSGRLEAALDPYAEARARFQALGDWEQVSLLDALEAEVLAVLGRRSEALESLGEALSRAPAVADSYVRHSIFVVAASATEELRSPAAARELRREAAEACTELAERPLCALDSWIRLAGMSGSVGEAKEDLGRARTELAGLPASAGRTRSEVELLEASAKWFARLDNPEADARVAAGLFGEAVSSFAGLGLPVSQARVLADRASLLEREGRGEEAAADYGAALELVRAWDRQGRWEPAAARPSFPSCSAGCSRASSGSRWTARRRR